MKEGIEGLKPRRRPKKTSEEPDLSKLTKEELIDIIKVKEKLEKIRNNPNHNHCKTCEYTCIDNYKGKISKRKLLLYLKIPRSSFYEWKANKPKKSYKFHLLYAITRLHVKYKGILGVRRITAYL